MRTRPAVYVIAGAPASKEQEALAVCLSLAAVASHRTAAFMWGLDGIDEWMLEFTVGRNQTKGPHGVRLHRVPLVPPCDVSVREAVPLTTPSRTVLDLGAVVPRDIVELALEDALRRGLTTLPRLRWRMDDLCTRGRPGCRALAELLAGRNLSMRPTESPLETKIWRFIRTEKLPLPVRQYVVMDGKNHIARLDIAYPDRKVAIEGHSYRFHSGRAAWEKDIARHKRLVVLGWRIVYVTSGDLTSRPKELADEIRAALNSERAKSGSW